MSTQHTNWLRSIFHASREVIAALNCASLHLKTNVGLFAAGIHFQ